MLISNHLLLAPKILYLEKYGPKVKNSLFKLNCGTETNSYVLNSMLTFLVFGWKSHFWANLFKKIKTKDEPWNLEEFESVEFYGDIIFFSFTSAILFLEVLIEGGI